MSWIVQRLLMDTPRIKETHDMESDEYNDLLIVEKKISSMKKNDLISDTEESILGYVTQGYLLSDVENFCGIGRDTAYKIFVNLCEKVAFSIGGEFTTDGYIDGVVERNHLDPDQEEIIRTFVGGRLRHKIIRRPLSK